MDARRERSDLWSGVNLATMMAELAQTLDTHPTLHQTLQAVVDSAARIVPGADFVSVTLNEKGVLSTPAYSHPVCLAPDMAQYETGEGPCLEAAMDDPVVRIDDLDAEQRWPAWIARVRPVEEIEGILAIRLVVEGPSAAALNLYTSTEGGFTPSSEAVAMVFAAHASLAMIRAEREEQLLTALEGRDVIGQAKGRVMERYGVDAEAAFEILRRTSRDSNTKLREVAEKVVAGTLDVTRS